MSGGKDDDDDDDDDVDDDDDDHDHNHDKKGKLFQALHFQQIRAAASPGWWFEQWISSGLAWQP